MMNIEPRYIILIGFCLLFFGFVAPFLMVIKVIDNSLWLSFLSYLGSAIGLLLGLVGTAWHSNARRK